MAKYFKEYFFIGLAVIVAGIGSSFMIKADIGINAYDGVATSVSSLLNIKVGTISIIFNVLCFLLQILILKKDFSKRRFLQLPILLLLGNVVNIALYTYLNYFVITNYTVRVILFCGGLLLCSISCAYLLNMDIGYPLEGLCQVISNKLNLSFSILRQSIDILCFVISISLYFSMGISLRIREGTIIAMIILGPLVQFLMKFIKIKKIN